MCVSRKFRSFAALAVLVSVLFSQGALAWYQCPADDAAKFVHSVAELGGARTMAGCDGMDMDQPSLCQAHAQAGNQSLERPHTPEVPLFAMAGFLVPPSMDQFYARPAVVTSDSYLLTRVIAPPIAVRNCCFRI
jgi:hypothetical protein